jgi:Flagellar hook-length control protein FliK
MQLSTLDNTLKAPADQPKGVDLTQFKVGDRLEARIVQISSSGRTILQFSGFRAVVDRLSGGREGDVMQFEVLPDEKAASGHDQIRRPSTAISAKSPGTPGQNGGPQNSKIVRLNALPEAGGSRGNAKEIALLTSKPVSQAPPFTLSTTTQATLPAHAFEIVSTWFRRFRKSRQLPSRDGQARSPILEKPELTKGLSQAKTAERPGMLEPDRVDRPRELHSLSGYNAFHLGNWPVKMKIYGPSPGRRTDTEQIFFKAIFLLNMEHTGAVRADIQMGENQIKVGFFVESEDCRAIFAAALPELSAALSSISKHCYCHVAVSPPKIHDFLQEEGHFPENPRFDIRA